MSMTFENNIQNNKKLSQFTIRMNDDMKAKVETLAKKKLLTKTSVIRLAVSEMYERELMEA